MEGGVDLHAGHPLRVKLKLLALLDLLRVKRPSPMRIGIA
jgi:hypothetical protein